MKPRHAAALALVGWYLMVPREQFGSERHPTPPWTVIAVLKDQSDCQRQANQMRASAYGTSGIDHDRADDNAYYRMFQAENAICVEATEHSNPN